MVGDALREVMVGLKVIKTGVMFEPLLNVNHGLVLGLLLSKLFKSLVDVLILFKVKTLLPHNFLFNLFVHLNQVRHLNNSNSLNELHFWPITHGTSDNFSRGDFPLTIQIKIPIKQH